ncbi:MAG: hypothetical protein L0J96_09280, partial [Lactococcus lactis]|nr:hypothetical protein [Lactococcus lactis]
PRLRAWRPFEEYIKRTEECSDPQNIDFSNLYFGGLFFRLDAGFAIIEQRDFLQLTPKSIKIILWS